MSSFHAFFINISSQSHGNPRWMLHCFSDESAPDWEQHFRAPSTPVGYQEESFSSFSLINKGSRRHKGLGTFVTPSHPHAAIMSDRWVGCRVPSPSPCRSRSQNHPGKTTRSCVESRFCRRAAIPGQAPDSGALS